MKIICKRKFHFIDGVIVKDKNGENTREIKNQLIIGPNTLPVEVPDWVRNDGLFDLAVKDGNLKIVS